MDKSAARPKWLSDEDGPVTVPMAPRDVRRNPSTDQKRQRREIARSQRATQRTATVLTHKARDIQPGESLLLPTGKTVTVNRRRNHESSSQHFYLDTDQGTIFAHGNDDFQVAPHNSVQQSLPGMGNPGGNSNSLPWQTQQAPGAGGSSNSGTTQCPNCRSRGTLRQSGDSYRCSNCGYAQSFGGPSGHDISSSPRVMLSSRYYTADSPLLSAVARRASEFASKETP